MRSLVTLLALVGNAITFPLSPGTPNSTLHSTGLSHPSEPPARDECTMSLAECFSACHMLEFSCIYDCQYTVCELEDCANSITCGADAKNALNAREYTTTISFSNTGTAFVGDGVTVADLPSTTVILNNPMTQVGFPSVTVFWDASETDDVFSSKTVGWLPGVTYTFLPTETVEASGGLTWSIAPTTTNWPLITDAVPITLGDHMQVARDFTKTITNPTETIMIGNSVTQADRSTETVILSSPWNQLDHSTETIFWGYSLTQADLPSETIDWTPDGTFVWSPDGTFVLLPSETLEYSGGSTWTVAPTTTHRPMHTTAVPVTTTYHTQAARDITETISISSTETMFIGDSVTQVDLPTETDIFSPTWNQVDYSSESIIWDTSRTQVELPTETVDWSPGMTGIQFPTATMDWFPSKTNLDLPTETLGIISSVTFDFQQTETVMYSGSLVWIAAPTTTVWITTDTADP